jgi:peptidoglycan/LPS O-acetylase OafA/YrhL
VTKGAYLTGLDGLRALAVAAVLLYHAGLLAGGFLGVEVFFVISGYLITSLLVREWQLNDGIDIRAFWIRRARRLVPASALTIVVTLAIAVVALPDEVASLRGAAAAALLSVSNWYAIFSQQSYFEAVGRPPLLRHYWSLAIEAQFYLVWPIALVFGLRRFRQRYVLVATLLTALASAAWMAVLHQPDGDPSRVYYGTDTRASGLLLGAALALAAPRWRLRGLTIDGAGALALGGLVFLCLKLGEYAPFLYSGGFALVGLLSVVTIAAAVHPQGHIGRRVLEWAPLRWLGVRSYGIYLWHWPVFMLTRPGLDVPLDGWPLFILRLTLVLLLADFSFRCVEKPWRSGTPRLRWGGAVAGALFGLTVLGGSVAAAKPPPPRPAYLPVDSMDTWQAPTLSAAQVSNPVDEPNQVSSSVDEPNQVSSSVDEPNQVSSSVDEANQVMAVPRSLRVTAIGDSVMLGSASGLQATIDGIEIDAAISRQASAAIEILRSRVASGALGDVVVVHIGNNGTISAGQFDEMMSLLSGVPRVVVVDVKVPRAWEGPNNAVLTDGVAHYPNAVLVDWNAASRGRPELFWDDGIHLRPEGALVYAQLIAEQVVPGSQ